MSDFDDLRQVREAKINDAARARQHAEAEQEQREEAARREEERIRSCANEYSKTVISVLKSLKEAIYPDLAISQMSLSLRRTYNSQGSNFERIWAAWTIVRQLSPDPETGGECSGAAVSVVLEFDKNGDPFQFVIRRETIIVEKVAPTQKSIMSKLFGFRTSDQHHTESTVVHFEPVTCGLTREELIRAFRVLHPPHTLDARPARG